MTSAIFDEDDYLFIVDRKKDIIIAAARISARRRWSRDLRPPARLRGLGVRRGGRAARRGARGGGLLRGGQADEDALLAFLAGGSPNSNCPLTYGSCPSRCPSSAPARSTRSRSASIIGTRLRPRRDSEATGAPLVHSCRWAEETDDENIRRQRRPGAILALAGAAIRRRPTIRPPGSEWPIRAATG